jgi:hypothetical protein
MYWRGLACAHRERSTFPDFVYLIDIDVHRPEAAKPRLSMSFYFLNASVYDIEFSGVSGRFRYQGVLSGTIEGKAFQIPTAVKRGKMLCVEVTQWISEDEVNQILADANKGTIHVILSHVCVEAAIHAPWKTGHKCRLKTPESVSVKSVGGWETGNPVAWLVNNHAERH